MSESQDSRGREIHELIRELYPICRSITGNGVRESLRRLRRLVPLELREVASGTTVFDWTVPKEWNIRDAWIKDTRGTKVVDFEKSNLHVVNYSVPVHRRVKLEELRQHLHTLPESPSWIPYRTSYYKETWGFCVSYEQYLTMQDAEYEVWIDSTLEDGSLTYGELLIPGDNEEEFLISAHICHPSLCDDNLSGVGVAAYLARRLLELDRRRWSYRFVFAPGTIGAIAWLAGNTERLSRLRGGMTLICLGDRQPLTYKRSLTGDSDIDRAAAWVLEHLETRDSRIIDFYPYGYDERQYNAPGFRISVGSLMRGRHGQFPEYHTSGDNLEFIDPASLGHSLETLWQIIQVLESNRTYRNLSPYGEPQLGRRGLVGKGGGLDGERQLALLWVLSLSDGSATLLDIAARSGMSFFSIRDAAASLQASGLLEAQPDRPEVVTTTPDTNSKEVPAEASR